MIKYANVLLLATALTSVYSIGLAQARGGGGQMGGTSGSHMSSSGLKNSNGPSSTDRDKGLARAEDRRSAKGAQHEKADRAHSKRTRKGKSGADKT